MRPALRPALTLSGLVFSAWLGGCAARSTPPAAVQSERAVALGGEATDAGFALAVRDLLTAPPRSPARAALLAAVEARQMARAAARFAGHASERGLAAVSGGLYLARPGEVTAATFGPQGEEALSAAVRELAQRGDEGRSRALYDVLLPLSPEPRASEVRKHLEALDVWTRDLLASGGSVATAGAVERMAVRRRLLEPSEDALAEADRATSDWIRRAVALRDAFRKTRVQPQREEGAEAWRALETGPLVLVAVYLRDADAAGALAALDRVRARDLLDSERPQLLVALAAMARQNSAEACGALLDQLRPLAAREPGRDEQDFAEDRDLFGAAAFSVAGECYRLDPTAPSTAFVVGVALQELGMAEAAPAVLAAAVHAHPDARTASGALALTLDAMAAEEDGGDADAARRAFAAAQPVLADVAQAKLAGKVRPSAAQVRAAMGEVEMRAGRLDEARAQFEQSVGEEPSGSVLLSLARIEARSGRAPAALEHLRAALLAPDAARDVALRGEVLLTLSDVIRENGDTAGARTPLTDALKDLVQSRSSQPTAARSRVECVLARVLDRFGAEQPAARALDRAYVAAAGDKHQAAATVELAIGRAFLRGDLPAAREGLQRALAADLDGDDLVYFALWVRLLERQLRVPTDGAPDHVFASIPEDGRWVATLARFGEGKLKGDGLISRAATAMQRYEALFYDAMDRRVAGDVKGGDELLRQVAMGSGIGLSEASLARDLLDPHGAVVGGPLPPDVSIP